MSDVDVVVVAYRSGPHLREAVVGLVDLAGVHVVVVDSACPDQSYREVSDLGVTIVHSVCNGGFAAGYDLGIAASASPSVLLLNADALIDNGDIERLQDALHASADIGAVAPRILRADGSLACSIRRFPRVRTTYAHARYLHRLAPRSDWADEVIRAESVYTRPGDLEASGAALLVRRPLLERGGIARRAHAPPEHPRPARPGPRPARSLRRESRPRPRRTERRCTR